VSTINPVLQSSLGLFLVSTLISVPMFAKGKHHKKHEDPAPIAASESNNKGKKKTEPVNPPMESSTPALPPVVKPKYHTVSVDTHTREDGATVVTRKHVNKNGVAHSTAYSRLKDGSRVTERDNGTSIVRKSETSHLGHETVQIERRQVSYKSGKNIIYVRETRSNSVIIKKTVINNNVVIVNNYNYNVYNYGRSRYYSYATPYEFWWHSRAILYDPWANAYGYPWAYSVPWYHPVSRYHNSYEWLTDYFFMTLWEQEEAEVIHDLAEAEAARYREEINEEVRHQIQFQIAEAMESYSHKTPLTIEPVVPVSTGKVAKPEYIFTVHQELNVIDDGGEKCLLSEGDLVRLKSDQQVSGESAVAVVVTAKSDSCDAGSEVHISLTDLQEMQNEFAQRIESGAKVLAEHPEMQP